MFWRRKKNKKNAPETPHEDGPRESASRQEEPHQADLSEEEPRNDISEAPAAPPEAAPPELDTESALAGAQTESVFVEADTGVAPGEVPPPAATLEALPGRAPEPESESENTPEAAARGETATPAAEPTGRGWLKRLKAGLARSSNKMSDGIGSIFAKRKLDDEALEELEELLISADLGVAPAGKLAAKLGKRRFAKDVDPDAVRGALAGEIAEVLTPVAQPLSVDSGHRPHVVLVVGVNGSGKTTTIGKLAKQWTGAGYKVHMAAGDTFRAAAVEQLQIWGERTGCPVTAKDTGADAAGLAYDALQSAQRAGADVLLIDTAGRLHNKSNLMAELQKIVRVVQKLDPSAPHDTLLVLDATVGQNAVQQVQTFRELVNVSGLALTKLDGSARGGIMVALAEKFGLPVHVIGVGETAEDLRPFDAKSFARALVGLDPEG